jgi:hypothetical protein
MRRSGANQLAAAGDSLLDLGMLQSADAAVRPAHGELQEQSFTLAHLRVSDHEGILGGEEIVGMLAAAVLGPFTGSGDFDDANTTFRVSSG